MSFFTADELPESLSWLPDAWNKQVDELARLRAELAALQTEHNAVAAKYKQKWQQAEAELAALKGRRCETCASADSTVDPHNPTHIYGCTNEDSVCFECWLVRDSDFACNRWAARAEEGAQ